MIRRALGVAAVAGAGALVASQWQDIVRYVKIREMSRSGDPSLVPVRGRTGYPTDRSQEPAAARDDFDPASRGAPAR
jgi:uncharacterized protein DUF6893